MGHTDAVVRDFKGPLFLVGSNLDFEIGIVTQNFRICLRPETEPVNGIRRIGYQFPQENLLIGVQGVDDQTQKLLHFGFELVCFFRTLHYSTFLLLCDRK